MKAITISGQTPVPHLTPDSGVTHCRNPFFVPEGIWWPTVLVGVRIDRLGIRIDRKFARRYYSEILSAVHPENVPPIEGHDYEWSRDGALVISDCISASGLDESVLDIFDGAIADVSHYMTLKTGDLILVPNFGARAAEAVTIQPLVPGMNLDIDFVPDGFPKFTLKVR